MSDLIRDEGLDALVRELNRSEAKSPTGSASEATGLPASDESRAEANDDSPLARLLAQAVQRGASDLLLLPGSPAVLRVAGRLAVADGPPLDAEDIRAMLAPHVPAAVRRTFEEQGAADLSLRMRSSAEAGACRAFRFRVNLHRQRGHLAVAVRVLPRDIPTLVSLGLPLWLAELTKPTRGLVLLCGPTGAGKTSTLAALVGEINRTRTCHVITIEDPIEYEHVNGRSIIEQVEIGSDAPSFSSALRAALRQDPDVLLVGEMRDLDTIGIALTAAETGHLVLSTLHTADAAQAIHRIVDVFPAAQQGQIRQQLALALHAIVCQQLIPRQDGRGRVPAIEVLIATIAVREHVRRERTQNLHNEITLGKQAGMITLEESLARLVRSGAIGIEEARIRATHLQELESLVRLQDAADSAPR